MSDTQRLSEGMDFIEEALGYSAPLDFSEVEETTIVESQSGSAFKIIGKARGQFQPIGEFSRNNRLYESDHWSHLLENTQFQDRIKSRDLLGTLGHHDKKVDDADIAAGIVSHIVTCLEQREDANGTPYLYGELEILDTPAGRNLKALYEGGANLYVSSRGAGKLLPVPGQTYKKVDKNSYFCETFDVVRRPGFLKAKPMFEQVAESVNEEAIDEKKENLSSPVYGKVNESEVDVLKSQVEKLAKIVEKVVDNIYDLPEEQVSEQQIPSKESLVDFVKLMSETNISEDAFCDVLDIILGEEK